MSFLTLWLSTLGVIFAIIDPFGYIPIFLTLTATDSEERRNWMLGRACVTSFFALAFFTVAGNWFLSFFGISIPALQIAGGLILLTIAFDMLRVSPTEQKLTPEEQSEASVKGDISIIPLAIPMLAGPASLATVVIMASKARSIAQYGAILLSVAATLGFTYWILRSATRVLSRIGLTGLSVVTRIMGFLLAAMAIQFIINGYVAIR